MHGLTMSGPGTSLDQQGDSGTLCELCAVESLLNPALVLFRH
jgi:hypothetical protein